MSPLTQVKINLNFECKIVYIFLPFILTYVLGANRNRLIETHREYPQHMFWLRNKKKSFCYALLTKGLPFKSAQSDRFLRCLLYVFYKVESFPTLRTTILRSVIIYFIFKSFILLKYPQNTFKGINLFVIFSRNGSFNQRCFQISGNDSHVHFKCR